MEKIMGFIRRFCTAAAAIIFIFVLAIQAFAVSIDGSVSPDEVRGTNVQIQCENENGGNGICALATYYTKTEKGSLYVAINGDISYADLTKESPVVYEIYVDGKAPIKIGITGKAEYDEQLFSVKSSASFAGGGITCETLIDRKYSFGGDPEIYVRVTDDKGIPSKMFEIDTYIAPPETTAEQNNQSGKSDSDDRDTTKTTKKSNSTKSTTKKESTTKKKSKSSSSKSSTKSKSKTNKSSSSKTNRSSKSQGTDEEYLADDVDEIETYTLPSGGNTRNAARVKQGVTAVGI
ncbi:MAG: hypothetical protein PUH26_04250, partial [Oscillospiraceae bacterium]|nr:hypothetical protein [Oscillospiraceae bacterium]MDY5582289.1 hypothetical protein [Oscillospiraceae bacterium]